MQIAICKKEDSMQTMTSREFSQDTSGAKRKALNGPVVITDRGAPSHVLMTWATYTGLSGCGNIADALACPETSDVESDTPRLDGIFLKPTEF
ncbi:MAG: type II toxin-antitoxin system Phd/YefM family antitoxin [Desulfovibrio sp.]|nr:type II toxin-antitoxin system Phd/YefM family antitoxin [Desulfovibrio sp.]